MPASPAATTRALERIHPRSMWADLDGTAGLVGGTANVVMQLALAPVGHGVVESVVDSGNVLLHPVKRLRTTLTYIAVAVGGTDEERARYRREVDRQHAQVRSREDSPVAYSAFDPELQLWVAACLHWGAVDLHERMHGPMPDAMADRWYAESARFGTALQMPAGLWPPDRTAFADLWAEGLARCHVDDTVRAYLLDLLDLRMAPGPVRDRLAPSHRFVSTGLLPAELRDQLHLDWDAEDERRHRRLLRRVGAVTGRLPGVLRRQPVGACLWDARRRWRAGRSVV